jgi:hypothetical protein
MKNLLVSVSVVFMFFATSQAQNLFTKTEITNGAKVTRTMTIPDGWEASYSMTNVHKSTESYIRSNQFWRTAEGSMFINIVSIDNETESVEDLIAFDMKSYAEFGGDKIQISNSKKIFIDNNKSIAIIKIITGSSDAPFQAVAYIPERNTVTQLTLVADTQHFFDENYPAFEEFLKSYSYQSELLPMVSRNSYY